MKAWKKAVQELGKEYHAKQAAASDLLIDGVFAMIQIHYLQKNFGPKDSDTLLKHSISKFETSLHPEGFRIP